MDEIIESICWHDDGGVGGGINQSINRFVVLYYDTLKNISRKSFSFSLVSSHNLEKISGVYFLVD